MTPRPVKYFFTFLILLLVTTAAFSQKEFFRSQQVFTKEQLSSFYSSVTIHDGLVIFNANNYTTCCYNKKTGKQVWLFNTNQKSNTPPGPAEIKIKTGNNKLLLHKDMEAGHGGASGRFKVLKDRAR